MLINFLIVLLLLKPNLGSLYDVYNMLAPLLAEACYSEHSPY